MKMTAVSSSVTQALVARLGTIKTSNGYVSNISKVFYPLNSGDYQQMGADLAEQDMPAIIFYQGPVEVEPQHHLNTMHAVYYLELVQPWVPDASMWQLVSDIGKAVWGGSPTADENTNFRFHEKVVDIQMKNVVPDFGMLQGHRIWVVVLLVQYRVRYTNL